MIALGADTIIMGERGELSPIETLIPGDDSFRGGIEKKGASAEDAKALMAIIESFGRIREKQRIDAFLRTMDRFCIIDSLNPSLGPRNTFSRSGSLRA